MRIRITFSVFVALVAVFALVLPVGAKTDRIAFTADDYAGPSAPADRDWYTPEGSMRNHARGLTTVYDTVSSEPLYDGTSTVVINWNVDWATMTGPMWGTFHLELDAYDGGYTGTWVGKFTGDQRVWVGHGVAHGYGDVDGYKVQFDLAWAPFGDTASGYILTPGNK